MRVEEVAEGVRGGWAKARCPICQKKFSGKKANGSLEVHLEVEHRERLEELDGALGTRFYCAPVTYDDTPSSLRPDKSAESYRLILKDVEERVLRGDEQAIARHFEAWSWSWKGGSVKSFLIRCGKLASGEILPGEFPSDK